MKAFRNVNYTTRNYDCTNVVACVGEESPGENWEPVDDSIIEGLTHLWTEAGVRYYGHI